MLDCKGMTDSCILLCGRTFQNRPKMVFIGAVVFNCSVYQQCKHCHWNEPCQWSRRYSPFDSSGFGSFLSVSQIRLGQWQDSVRPGPYVEVCICTQLDQASMQSCLNRRSHTSTHVNVHTRSHRYSSTPVEPSLSKLRWWATQPQGQTNSVLRSEE